MADAAPKKFWHPLSFGVVVLIFFITQLVLTLIVVALRAGLGWPVPIWIGNGLGGALGVVVVGLVAQRRHAAG